MKIVLNILIILMLLGATPLVLGYLYELILEVSDLVRGKCTPRDTSPLMIGIWKYFTVMLVLFCVCLVILTFLGIFNAFTKGIIQ